MMNNRRGFLGMLASFPVVGWMLGRESVANVGSLRDEMHLETDGLSSAIEKAQKSVKEYQEAAQHLIAHHTLNAPIFPGKIMLSRVQGEYFVTAASGADGFDRIIRWIPISERLPEFVMNGPDYHFSDPVLVTDGIEVRLSSLIKPVVQFDHREFFTAVDNPTHWAELPAPPEAK